MKFIIRLLPTMKSTTCVSCQAGRQMRWEEEKEKALGSSTKIKVKKKKTDIKNHYIHTYKEKSLSCSYLSESIPVSFYIW